MVTHSTNPVDLAYGEAGQGPPLVLLHGLGSSRNDWLLQLLAFVPRYRTVAVDLRGHGSSPKPPGPYGIPLLATDVARLLTRIEARPAHVLGLSLGGAVTLQLALDFPHLVRSLILVNTAAHFISSDWRQRLMGVRRFASVYLSSMDQVAAGGRGAALSPSQARLRCARKRESALAPTTGEPIAPRCGPWRASTCATGWVRSAARRWWWPATRTPPCRWRPSDCWRSASPGSRLEIIAASGHATPLDQPETFKPGDIAVLGQATTVLLTWRTAARATTPAARLVLNLVEGGRSTECIYPQIKRPWRKPGPFDCQRSSNTFSG
jgi:3-oxoadipate enol-lactonase